MPRQRTIFCEHCGYALLKSDNICGPCGKMTALGKKRLAVNAGGVITVAILATIVALYIASVGKGMLPI